MNKIIRKGLELGLISALLICGASNKNTRADDQPSLITSPEYQ